MVLEIISVCLKRNKRVIFDNFNLKLNKSQIMILIGENGAGKTSLLDLVAGVLEPEKGTIKINNISSKNLNSNKRDMYTYLSNKDALKENLTIEENLMIWSKISSNKFIETESKNVLDYFGLRNLGKNLVGNLSQGQRKKVTLTKLLLSKAKLWLLDEPFNSLDSKSVKKTIKLIYMHSKNGGSILLTNHIDLNFRNSKKITLFNSHSNLKKNKPTFHKWGDF